MPAEENSLETSTCAVPSGLSFKWISGPFPLSRATGVKLPSRIPAVRFWDSFCEIAVLKDACKTASACGSASTAAMLPSLRCLTGTRKSKEEHYND